ncbi:type II toxin-antitoxin system RelE/ParE family toxin [Polaribacter cellanae]|uniref:Type II toxin-antitoxin system RelE/ParE family toxin n=1 Tax=Polaribacter cellanae TaxID=2818493 RepID=A0A975CK77_9FLAO|nr:type II toxin-antitoxin system RelE/ParE family toxin [Polaribacter cellanae]QTE21161.1 type II toxin-antitoxin system RelE/ParE family toxin [Polaribacter cellanae]QTE21167.1 type II toxin-antitoxin system RelE/ParE family toxin [Polaribacter cellanae]QTE21172.1 type II toxin-antitoxin system RelE/ParE family toxin [Polaribacter cellanae]QTE21203.1 type II toxin-antitoxin system RelE/ParE family toxin [Polaribacter cellanae]
MSYSIKLLPIVHTDLKKAKKWYNKEREGLGEEFKIEVNKEIDYIGEYPQHYQRKYKELRQSLVTRFPYAIFYLVEEQQKRIVIFGVLHTRRNPEIARKRMKK